MFNFDFHNLLNFIEFEALCRDILEIRDDPLKFTTYKVGKDGGIDFKCTKNSPLKIIGQAKLYKDKKNLLGSLKDEVTKCKRQKPDRYILCISIELDSEFAEKILNLFEGYIKNEEDIIDRIKLNKYFNDEDKRYNHLLKSYSKLLVPNFQVIENMLNDVVNRKYINASRDFISHIKDKHRLYCNDILKNCLEVLEQNKVIILTGNPGVGKTTTARMLVQYFLSVESDKKYEFYALRNTSFLEIDNLFEIVKQQIFVFDDFWGSQFNGNITNETKNRNYQKTFVEILSRFRRSKNHYLILTSRNYIIRDTLTNAEQDFKDIVEINNFTVDLNNFSNEVKAKIFLNHLVFYGKDISYFKGLKYENRLERIIKHRNYTPRHIEYFFTRIHKDSLQNGFGFDRDFLSYLEKPQDFWNNLFDSQNDNSKLILILIFISSDPIEIKDLKESYFKIQKSTREELNLNLQPLEFEKDLYLLEDVFISSEKWEYIEQVLLSFQSPGIKDFLLEYLRQNIHFFGEILIKGAIFFNQLYYIFTTTEGDVLDDDVDISLYGQKIKLSDKLQKILKNKILKEFDELNFSTHNDREFAGEFSNYNTSEETKYWKLTLFSSFFDISDIQNQNVREFIIQEVFKDIDTYGHREGKIVDIESMTQFSTVLKIIKPYVKFQQGKLINDYYQSTTFIREFNTFHDFKELFPTEFKNFIDKNIVEIRQKIKSTILDDIDYFQWEDDDLELDVLLNYYIEKVCKAFRVKLTDKFLKEIKDLSGREVFLSKKIRKATPKSKKIQKPVKEKKLEKSNLNEIIQEYLPNSEYEEINPVSIIKKHSDDLYITKFLLNEVKTENSIFSSFFSKKILIIALVEYLSTIKSDLLFANQYNLLNSFSQHLFLQNGIDEKIAEKVLSELAIKSEKYECYFSHNQLIATLSEQRVSNYEPIQLYPFIIENGNWFTFSSKTFEIYFSVKYAEKIISYEEFRDFIENTYFDEDKMEFLKMLNEVTPKKLQDIVILPELGKFVQLINPSSEKDTCLAFLKFFEITIDLILKGKKFEDHGGGGANIYLELLLNFIGLEFETMSFDIYFLKDYQYEENVEKFFIKKEYYDDLFEAVVSQNTLKKSRRFWDDKPYKYYEIDLYNFAQNNSNYEILKNVGMEKYIMSIFSYVSQYFQDAKNNLYL